MVKQFFYNFLNKIHLIIKLISRNWEDQELILQAKLLMSSESWQSDISEENTIEDKEFKVYSQWGDDGIIQYLIKKINVQKKIFVEFGVADFFESNSHFLLINNNWKGLVIDGSEKNIKRLKGSEIYWRYNLKALAKFITKDNIMEIISSEIDSEIGLLHIDLDGNDFWVLKEIDLETLSPEIVILEYNYIFGHERKITTPYDKSFHRFKNHHSGLFFGASLSALDYHMSEKGYYFIGSNSSRNNAYFVKKEYSDILDKVNLSSKYVDAQFRISRNKRGESDYSQPQDVVSKLRGLPVYNVETNQLEEF